MKTRRDFLKGILAVGGMLAVPILVPDVLPKEELKWFKICNEPKCEDIHVDKQLTDISAAYCSGWDTPSFISHKVFLELPSPEKLIRERLLEIQEKEFTKMYFGSWENSIATMGYWSGTTA